MLESASENPAILASTIKKIETFSKSLKTEVESQVRSVREERAELEALNKAREIANQREMAAEVNKNSEHQLRISEKIVQNTMDIEQDDSDLENFIETDPWENAKKNAPPAEATKSVDKGHSSFEEVIEPSSKKDIKDQVSEIDEAAEQTLQAPKLKIQQKKLKPKGAK